jgi:signal transduction histidine kinase
MELDNLELFSKLNDAPEKENWKKALDALFLALRKMFVYDNLAVYLVEQPKNVPEATYARAVGRGRSKEAEASWGEEIANQAIASGRIVSSRPKGNRSSERTAMPYLLGLPFDLPTGNGVLVFVRFGGPEYSGDQMALAVLAAAQTARIFERRSLQSSMFQLEQARHKAQLQDDFIATISHELHTPLGFIKGYATSLLRSDTTWDPATQKEFLTIIDEESDHLLTLIDRMLDSARLQSGNMVMDFQPVRVDALLRDLIQRLTARDAAMEVTLDLKTAPLTQADSVRLAQVFSNLIENARKYAPDSPIVISLDGGQEMLVATISDYGPGIPTEHLPFLFERFYRVPGHGGKRGTGLGLFICKQIILAHQGQITVKTTPGKGTSFRIELPVRQAQEG